MPDPTRLINPTHHTTFTQVPDWLLERTELSPGAKLCYARLARYFNAHPQHKNVAAVSTTVMGEKLAVGERQVYSYIKELVAVGLIGVRRRGLGSPNHYVFFDHPWRDETAGLPFDADPDRKDSSDQELQDSSGLGRKDSSDPTGRIVPTKIQGGKIQNKIQAKERSAPRPEPTPITPTPRKAESIRLLTMYGVKPTRAATLNAASAILDQFASAGRLDELWAFAEDHAGDDWSWSGFRKAAADQFAGRRRNQQSRNQPQRITASSHTDEEAMEWNRQATEQWEADIAEGERKWQEELDRRAAALALKQA